MVMGVNRMECDKRFPNTYRLNRRMKTHSVNGEKYGCCAQYRQYFKEESWKLGYKKLLQNRINITNNNNKNKILQNITVHNKNKNRE